MWTICSLFFCNNTNGWSFKSTTVVCIGKKFLFFRTPWYATKKNLFNYFTQRLNYFVDCGGGPVQASAIHTVTSSHSLNEVILELSSFRQKVGCWRILWMSIAGSSGWAFETLVRAKTSNLTGGCNAYSYFRRACTMPMLLAQGDPDLPEFLVSLSRSGRTLVQKYKNALDILKYMCLLEDLNSFATRQL